MKVFKDFIFLQRDLETAKIELALKPDFNLVQSFQELDTQSRGWIYGEQLSEGLERQGMGKVSREELFLFMKKFDLDQDSRIQFSDFCLAFTPLNSEYA